MSVSPAASVAYSQTPRVVAERDSSGKLNPFFDVNLPFDYAELSAKGKKMARLNGLRLQGPDPNLFVRSWSLWRSYYLAQLPDGAFYKQRINSPPCHYDAIRDVAQHQLNAWAFPRGSGKSTVMGRELPMHLLLTRPNFDLLMVLAKDDFVTKRFSAFMRQFTTNPYILEDFGEMKRARGSGVWNHHFMELENGSTITGIPVEGKMLGERPDLFLVDDPEFARGDDLSGEAAGKRSEAMEALLFNVILPMLKEGSGIGWIGTLVSVRCFLYRLMHSHEHQFKFWNRRILAGLKDDGSSLWPERWSNEELDQLRELWGEEAFQGQMQNRPGSGKTAMFKIHPKFHIYTLEDEGPGFGVNPTASEGTLKSYTPLTVKRSDGYEVVEEKLVERTFNEAMMKMDRIMTVDFAFTVTKTADFSCCHVLGYENSDDYKDTLWSLDMWLGKQSPAEFIKLLLAMAYKWRVRVIAPEAISIQQQLVDMISSGADLMAQEGHWRPQIFPLRYPANFPKSHRIAGLDWRFDKYKIKLPGDRRDKWPYNQLFRQIENFTLDLSRLPYDDAIDTLAMFQFVGHRRGGFAPVGEPIEDPIEMLRQGKTVDSRGLPLGARVPLSDWPLGEMIQHQMDEAEQEGSPIWMPSRLQ